MPSYIDQLRADIQPSYSDELCHYGVKGMKWGVRRYQNTNGSLTNQGKKRYLSDETKRKLKTGAKVAAGVAGAAALGYGLYKVGRAGDRLRTATAYKQASKTASSLGIDMHSTAKQMLGSRDSARTRGEYQHYLRLANNYSKAGRDYLRQSNHLAMKAAEIKQAGGVSDRLAYRFVESLIKNPKVDYNLAMNILLNQK